MTIRRWLRALLCLLACLQATVSSAAPGSPVRTGSPAAVQVTYEFAIYYTGKPARPPLAALQTALAQDATLPRRVESLPREARSAVLVARLNPDVQKDYRPPDLSLLQRFGRGLSREQAEAMQSSTLALIVRFAHPQKVWMAAYRRSLQLMAQLAEDTGGLLWDEETREVFTLDQWRKRRLDTWDGNLPDVSQHTVIHAYQSDNLVRAITLGMGKFGLPDVVVQDFSWSMNRPMGNLINLLSQSLAEGLHIGPGGRVELAFKTLQHAGVRRTQSSDLLAGSKGRAALVLVEGRPERGDPDNRLVEIRFDAAPGKDAYARQEALLSSLYGSQDSITYVKHDAALLAARDAARARLPALQQAFAAGLTPGEYLLVKAPFDTPAGGVEWMWVEVTSWKGDAIQGLLKNEPFNIPSLHGGQMVTVSQARLFDYIRRYPDGREEGNETGRLMQKRTPAPSR
ncbi:MAG: DUF2314 domain-containing protein [Methylotenera sp.]|jgi:uncharacterized protein YegJ (DUF2314 family)|nr:DUF2314 domain-containing protein [Methylotenera sp.]